MQPQSNQLNFNFIFEEPSRQKAERHVQLTIEEVTEYGKMFSRLAGKATTIPYAKMVDFMRNSCLKNYSLTEILLLGLKSPLESIGLKQFQTIMKLVACRQAGHKLSEALLTDEKVKRSLAKMTEDAVFTIQKDELTEYENQSLFVKNGKDIQAMTKTSQDVMSQILQLTGLFKKEDSPWTPEEIIIVLHLVKKSQIFSIPKILPSCLAKMKSASTDPPNYESMLLLGQHDQQTRLSLPNTKKYYLIRTSSDMNKTPRNMTNSDKDLFFQPSSNKAVSAIPEPNKALLSNFDQFMSMATETQPQTQPSPMSNQKQTNVPTANQTSVVPVAVSPAHTAEIIEKPIEGHSTFETTPSQPITIPVQVHPPETLDIFSTNMHPQNVQTHLPMPVQPQIVQLNYQIFQPQPPNVQTPQPQVSPVAPQMIQLQLPPITQPPPIVQPQPSPTNQLQYPPNFSAFDSISTSEDNVPKSFQPTTIPSEIQNVPTSLVPFNQPTEFLRIEQLEKEKQSLYLYYIQCKAYSEQLIHGLRQENQKLVVMLVETVNMNRQLLRYKSESNRLFRYLSEGYQTTINSLLEAYKYYENYSMSMQNYREIAIQDVKNSQIAINNLFRNRLEAVKKTNYDVNREISDLAKSIEDEKLAIGIEFSSSPPKQLEREKAWEGFEEGVKKEERKPSADWALEKVVTEEAPKPNMDWFVKENL